MIELIVISVITFLTFMYFGLSVIAYFRPKKGY